MFEGLKALNAKILKMYSDFLVYEDFVNMAEGDNVRFCLSYLKEKKFPNIDSFSDIYERVFARLQKKTSKKTSRIFAR